MLAALTVGLIVVLLVVGFITSYMVGAWILYAVFEDERSISLGGTLGMIFYTSSLVAYVVKDLVW